MARSRGSSQPNAKAFWPTLGGFMKDDSDEGDGSEYLGSGAAKRASEQPKGSREKREKYLEEAETGKTSSRTHPSSKNRY